jgi:preprotein translocase subunit YajC
MDGSLLVSLLPFIAIAFLFYFMLIRPQRREQVRRQAMLAALKKNDRVVTIGGIYGVVTSVRREKDEVIIRVDENNDTKIRVQVGAIGRVLEAEDSNESAARNTENK